MCGFDTGTHNTILRHSASRQEPDAVTATIPKSCPTSVCAHTSHVHYSNTHTTEKEQAAYAAQRYCTIMYPFCSNNSRLFNMGLMCVYSWHVLQIMVRTHTTQRTHYTHVHDARCYALVLLACAIVWARTADKHWVAGGFTHTHTNTHSYLFNIHTFVRFTHVCSLCV